MRICQFNGFNLYAGEDYTPRIFGYSIPTFLGMKKEGYIVDSAFNFSMLKPKVSSYYGASPYIKLIHPEVDVLFRGFSWINNIENHTKYSFPYMAKLTLKDYYKNYLKELPANDKIEKSSPAGLGIMARERLFTHELEDFGAISGTYTQGTGSNFTEGSSYEYGIAFQFLYTIEGPVTPIDKVYNMDHVNMYYENTVLAKISDIRFFIGIPVNLEADKPYICNYNLGALGNLITGFSVYRREKTADTNFWGPWYFVTCIDNTIKPINGIVDADSGEILQNYQSSVIKVSPTMILSASNNVKYRLHGVVTYTSTVEFCDYKNVEIGLFRNSFSGVPGLTDTFGILDDSVAYNRPNTDIYYFGVTDVGSRAVTYEDRNGSTAEEFDFNFRLACNIGNRMVFGGINNKVFNQDGERTLLISEPSSLNINLSNNSVALPSIPYVLTSHGNRIFAFDHSNTFIIDGNNLEIAEHIKDIGCGVGDEKFDVLALDSTEEGIFWADRKNCYMFDGQTIHKIGNAIQQAGIKHNLKRPTGESYPQSWQDTVAQGERIQVLVDSYNKKVMFGVLNPITAQNGKWMIWTWHMAKRRWDYFEHNTSGINNADSNEAFFWKGATKKKVYHRSYNFLGYERLYAGDTRLDWQLQTKDLHMNGPYQKKRLYYIKIDPDDSLENTQIGISGSFPNQTSQDKGELTPEEYPTSTYDISRIGGKFNIKDRITKSPYFPFFHSIYLTIKSSSIIQNISVIYRKMIGLR